MKLKKFAAVVSAALMLAVFTATPALAADEIEVNEDISVSGDYDWTRFANDHITLNVYNNGLYISDGSDDSVNVVSAFEDLTGIKVNYTTYDSNESLYAKLKSGGVSYDVIFPSDYMVGKMINEGMLAELDMDNIPNIAGVGETYLDRSFDPGNKYSVPYMWGTTGLIYNTTMVEEPPTKWADMWDVEYTNNVLMFNNSRDAYAIAAKVAGLSMNPQSVDEITAITEKLKEQKNIVQAYVMDEVFDKMEGGEAAMAPYYAGDAITMIDENPDLAFVHPEEGVNFFIDSMCVPANAKHKEAAEMFINYLCETSVGLANCDFIGYSTSKCCCSASSTAGRSWSAISREMSTSEVVMSRTSAFCSLTRVNACAATPGRVRISSPYSCTLQQPVETLVRREGYCSRKRWTMARAWTTCSESTVKEISAVSPVGADWEIMSILMPCSANSVIMREEMHRSRGIFLKLTREMSSVTESLLTPFMEKNPLSLVLP